MSKDPGQRLGVAGAIVPEPTDGDHRTAGVGDLDLIEVSVGVHPDDCIHHFRQHGHWPAVLPCGQRSTSAPVWVQVTAVAYL